MPVSACALDFEHHASHLAFERGLLKSVRCSYLTSTLEILIPDFYSLKTYLTVCFLSTDFRRLQHRVALSKAGHALKLFRVDQMVLVLLESQFWTFRVQVFSFTFHDLCFEALALRSMVEQIQFFLPFLETKVYHLSPHLTWPSADFSGPAKQSLGYIVGGVCPKTGWRSGRVHCLLVLTWRRPVGKRLECKEAGELEQWGLRVPGRSIITLLAPSL